MNPETIENLIASGTDTPEARMAAGQGRLKNGDLAAAIEHLSRAVAMKPDYTAAWQALGTAYRESDDAAQARAAWAKGLEAARSAGDKQAEKVMGVFLRRLDRE